MNFLTIGKVAREAGVNVETVRYYEQRGLIERRRSWRRSTPHSPVRYYERRGLIERPASRQGAYRVYPAETAARIRSIKCAQKLGFSLDEIKELLALRVDAEARCGDVWEQTEQKIKEIDEKINSFQAVKRSLRRLAEACRMELPVTECPILKSLGEPR